MIPRNRNTLDSSAIEATGDPSPLRQRFVHIVASSRIRLPNSDARDIGERSDAVLRTALRGHDGRQPTLRRPCCLSRRGRRLSSASLSASPEGEWSAVKRARVIVDHGLPSICATGVGRPHGSPDLLAIGDQRLTALHGRHFANRATLSRRLLVRLVSQLLAGGVVTPGWSPGTPEERVTSSPHRDRIPFHLGTSRVGAPLANETRTR
jgi:hypothetical protein